MIPAAGIQDQELPIAAKRAGVNYPAIARRCDLRAGVSANRQALLRSTNAVGAAKIADFRTINGQAQMSAHRRKGDRRREAPWILER